VGHDGLLGEATGTNWAAAGQALSLTAGYPTIDERSGRALVAFDELEVANVTVTFRSVLIYNASKANRAILILDRGIDVVVTAGPLVLRNLTIPLS